jgi:hypothetical protein
MEYDSGLVMFDYGHEGPTEVLREIREGGFKPLFVPDLVDARIATPQKSMIWQRGFTTLSLAATGRTKGKSAVTVYVHEPNYFSDADNISHVMKKWENFRGGNGRIPKKEFWKYVDRADGKKVFVVDHNKLKAAPSSVTSLEDVLEHPQTIPILGGGERAKKYLVCWKEGRDKFVREKTEDPNFMSIPEWSKFIQDMKQRISVVYEGILMDEPYGNLLSLNGAGASVCSYNGFLGGLLLAMPPRGGYRQISRLDRLIKSAGFGF